MESRIRVRRLLIVVRTVILVILVLRSTVERPAHVTMAGVFVLWDTLVTVAGHHPWMHALQRHAVIPMGNVLVAAPAAVKVDTLELTVRFLLKRPAMMVFKTKTRLVSTVVVSVLPVLTTCTKLENGRSALNHVVARVLVLVQSCVTPRPERLRPVKIVPMLAFMSQSLRKHANLMPVLPTHGELVAGTRVPQPVEVEPKTVLSRVILQPVASLNPLTEPRLRCLRTPALTKPCLRTLKRVMITPVTSHAG